MALFARKNKNADADPNGTAVANAAATLPTSPSNGSANGTSVNGDAFSTDDEDALYQKAVGRKGRKGNKSTRVSRGLKGGAVVGLNIGNESIKAVEIRGKGLDVAVTALGSIPTPPDCLSNGVILNPVSLSSALRDLFVQSGIKSRNVISSVSGSGALVVRVLEVARMSDAELSEHMNTDLERYVPFPPNEVVKDYRPLRELPTDPDAPNMEVLLAAAQNEVIDQHLAVLKDAKVEPQAIDVEPLAAARAIFYDANNNDPNVDYNAATAVVNIGATNTEISVLRGDILVFTRSVPVGGHALTQALCDTLGMAWPDAEQTKFEMGDALPPHSGETPTVADDTDWSAFGDSDGENADPDPFSSDFYNDGPDGEPSGADPQVQQHQKQDGDETPVNSESASGENEPRLPAFDLTRFNFSEEEGEVDYAIPTTPVEASEEAERDNLSGVEGFVPKPVSVEDVAAAISTMSSGRVVPATPDVIAPLTSSNTQSDFDDALLPAEDTNAKVANRTVPVVDEDDTSRLPGVLDFPMVGEDEGLSGMAPSGQMYGMDSAEDPDLISFPTLPTGLLAAGREDDMVYGEDTLPTMIDEDDDAPAQAGEQISGLPSMDALTEVSSQTSASTTSAVSSDVFGSSASPTDLPISPPPVESVFDFSDMSSTTTAPIDDFESAFADMIGDVPSSVVSPGANPAIAAPSVSPSAFAMDATLATEQSDFNLDQFATPSGSDSFGLDDFGFGMAGGDSGTLTPLKVYEVLQPRLQELVAEIRRSLEYFASRYPDASVQRIVLIGGGSRLPNMDAMLTQEIGIPTVIDRPLSRLKLQVPNLPAEFVDEQGATFAVATGLALRDLVA